MKTKKFSSAVDDWVRRVDGGLDALVKQSANDMFEKASRIKPAQARGGTITPGYVPRDFGFLAGSAQFSINNAVLGSGEAAYEMSIALMKAGDVAELVWTAAYARKVHYAGWMWVDVAANDWSAIVANNVQRLKVEFGL